MSDFPIRLNGARRYWSDAFKQFKSVRILAVAALIVALRVAVKLIRVPLAAGLYLTFDGYINALGSLIYGPAVALAVGAVSDTLGCIIAPSGPYFFPFIFVEMASSFIFALYFWRKPLTLPRILAARFSVSFVCNILLTSLIMKWNYYVFEGIEKAQAYNLINGVRIAKNLVLFPLEAVLICLLFSAMLPALKSIGLCDKSTQITVLKRRHMLELLLLSAVACGLFLFYWLYFKDFISAHNFKFL